MKRFTQKDIAKQLGIHVSTVSLALNNSPKIPEETKVKILAVAREFGYKPDPAMSALIQYRKDTSRGSETIGKIAFLTWWDSPREWERIYAHNGFYEGANERASELGYDLENIWLGQEGMTPRRMGDILYNRGIKGVIVSSFKYPKEDYAMDWKKFCAVKINLVPVGLELNCIRNDQMQMIRLAFSKIIEKGYRRIGLCLNENWAIGTNHMWECGFLYEQSKLKEQEKVPIFLGPFMGKKLFQNWYQEHLPEVIIGMQGQLESWLEDINVVLGKDVAFVDIDKKSGDKCAGIMQRHTFVGRTAVDVLHGQMVRNDYGQPTVAGEFIVPGEWSDGDTLPPRNT